MGCCRGRGLRLAAGRRRLRGRGRGDGHGTCRCVRSHSGRRGEWGPSTSDDATIRPTGVASPSWTEASGRPRGAVASVDEAAWTAVWTAVADNMSRSAAGDAAYVDEAMRTAVGGRAGRGRGERRRPPRIRPRNDLGGASSVDKAERTASGGYHCGCVARREQGELSLCE